MPLMWAVWFWAVWFFKWGFRLRIGTSFGIYFSLRFDVLFLVEH